MIGQNIWMKFSNTNQKEILILKIDQVYQRDNNKNSANSLFYMLTMEIFFNPKKLSNKVINRTIENNLKQERFAQVLDKNDNKQQLSELLKKSRKHKKNKIK